MTQAHPINISEAAKDDLLLSSLASFWNFLESLLSAVQPGTMCEVGVGNGEFSALLVAFCEKNSCDYAGIDLCPTALRTDANNKPFAKFFNGSSLSVLGELPPQDVYFLDGDHNYYTVGAELNLILKSGAHWPLIMLHDVCWPWGRRDQYCLPEMIPGAFRHSHSKTLGLVPGRYELGPGGFSGQNSFYSYAAATHEGGPLNGVRTAVEDFLRQDAGKEWRLSIVPAIFGLGILYAPRRLPPAATAIIDGLSKSVTQLSPLLELMERNRLELFSRFLAIHDDYNALAEHEVNLRAEYDRLLVHTNRLQEAYNDLLAVKNSAGK